MNILKVTNANRTWYEKVLWWEVRRLPYNVIMYFVGVLSFYIGYITIPLIYLLIGLALNVIYTFGWIIELLFISRLQNESKRITYPRNSFIWYLILSSVFVVGIPILLLLQH
jgi:hypothetical protein